MMKDGARHRRRNDSTLALEAAPCRYQIHFLVTKIDSGSNAQVLCPLIARSKICSLCNHYLRVLPGEIQTALSWHLALDKPGLYLVPEWLPQHV